jgi:hypothetical protein
VLVLLEAAGSLAESPKLWATTVSRSHLVPVISRRQEQLRTSTNFLSCFVARFTVIR